MRILAITGGVATGKSTVTQMLGILGAPTLSADALARDLLGPGTEASRAVLAAFPQCALPGRREEIDRPALGRVIFADAAARAHLEALTHPQIIRALHEAAARWRAQPGACAALEIPLLFEAGLESIADSIVVAACPLATQVARLRARLGIDDAQARQQIGAQWPLEKKKQRAHAVIDTGCSLQDTERQTQALWKEWCR